MIYPLYSLNPKKINWKYLVQITVRFSVLGCLLTKISFRGYEIKLQQKKMILSDCVKQCHLREGNVKYILYSNLSKNGTDHYRLYCGNPYDNNIGV